MDILCHGSHTVGICYIINKQSIIMRKLGVPRIPLNWFKSFPISYQPKPSINNI